MFVQYVTPLWALGSAIGEMWGRNNFFFFYFSAGKSEQLDHTGVKLTIILIRAGALVSTGIPKEQY